MNYPGKKYAVTVSITLVSCSHSKQGVLFGHKIEPLIFPAGIEGICCVRRFHSSSFALFPASFPCRCGWWWWFRVNPFALPPCDPRQRQLALNYSRPHPWPWPPPVSPSVPVSSTGALRFSGHMNTQHAACPPARPQEIDTHARRFGYCCYILRYL
jgi:hypothetical protein